jgi:hypothetical protein
VYLTLPGTATAWHGKAQSIEKPCLAHPFFIYFSTTLN